jgi:hypothetical protein
VFAALGAEVAVFQWGWAKQLLGITAGVTLSSLPVTSRPGSQRATPDDDAEAEPGNRRGQNDYQPAGEAQPRPTWPT